MRVRGPFRKVETEIQQIEMDKKSNSSTQKLKLLFKDFFCSLFPSRWGTWKLAHLNSGRNWCNSSLNSGGTAQLRGRISRPPRDECYRDRDAIFLKAVSVSYIAVTTV